MTTLTPEEALAGPVLHHSLSRPGNSIEEVAAEIVGLHATSPASPYLSLRARLPGFARADLDQLMWGSWRLARMRAMRLTMFVFPTDLLEMAAGATRHLVAPLSSRWLEGSGLAEQEYDRLAEAVLAALEGGPLTVRGLRRALGVPQAIDLSGVVGRMCDAGRVVGGAPPRSWRSSVRVYHLWEHVLPHVDPYRRDEPAAVRELVGRYIHTYGPVTIDDISWWTGITKERCRKALAGLDVEQVAVEGWPGPLYRSHDGDAGEEPGSGVVALPLLDPYVQGYRDRTRYLDPVRHSFVYDGGGNATATLLHRGRIVGVWQVAHQPEESVRYHLFAGGPARVRRAAEADLAAAGAFYFDHPVDVLEAATMDPLTARGGRSASHPLDGRPHRASRRRTKP